jgi:hypothetical protein
MNKVIKIILKIFSKILFGIILFIILCYFGLWIYTINYVQKDFKEYYKNVKLLDLNEEQYKIIWFTITENKDYRFNWRPFILDIISGFISAEKPSNDIIDIIAAEYIIIFEFGYKDLNSAHLRYYALMRYIRFDNNWKKCISIIFNHYTFRNSEINNIEEASIFYYNKELKNINEKELIGLILLFNNYKYEIGTDFTQNKINEIYNRYNNK